MIKTFVLTSVLIVFFVMSGHDADALCVKVSEANLRSGPGTKYEKTWEVFKYMPFKKLKRRGNWYKVRDFEDDEHWIYRKLVTDRYNCGVVKVDKANIRTGPGTQYAKAAMAAGLMYDSFRILKIKSGWAHVVDEFGDRGWIYRKLLWIY